METVKVDFQKLQQLNDRIAQTIDALNQLRLTTHGLQHSAPGISQVQAQPMAPQQPVGLGFVQQPQLAQQLIPGMPQPMFAGQVLPGMGIMHTTPVADPYWQIRASQTFPFAAYNYPPVVSFY